MGVSVYVDDSEVREPFLIRLSGWTEKDYFRLAPQSRLCDFVHGEVFMHSPVSDRHDDLVAFLREILAGFVRARRLGRLKGGPYTMRLEPGLDYEPDLFVVRAERASAITRMYLEGAADLVLEVVSRGTRSHDLKRKRTDYESHGVPECWAVDDPNQMLIVFRRVDGRYTSSEHASGRADSSALPGFWLDVSWLWQDPLPDPQECLRAILGR